MKEENRDLLVEDLRSRSNSKGLFTKYFYLSNLAETSFPQIVFLCFICVYLFNSVFCICVYLLVLLFRFGRVVRHWAGCTALPPPPLEFSPPWARGQDPSLSSTTGSGKRAFLSRLSNFKSPRRLKPLSCTSHLRHDIRKDFKTQEGPKILHGQ